jgi:hypothetical protein
MQHHCDLARKGKLGKSSSTQPPAGLQCVLLVRNELHQQSTSRVEWHMLRHANVPASDVYDL